MPNRYLDDSSGLLAKANGLRNAQSQIDSTESKGTNVNRTTRGNIQRPQTRQIQIPIEDAERYAFKASDGGLRSNVASIDLVPGTAYCVNETPKDYEADEGEDLIHVLLEDGDGQYKIYARLEYGIGSDEGTWANTISSDLTASVPSELTSGLITHRNIIIATADVSNNVVSTLTQNWRQGDIEVYHPYIRERP